VKAVYAWHKKGKDSDDLPKDCFSVTPTWVNDDPRGFTKSSKRLTFLFRVRTDSTTSTFSRPFYLKSAFATFVGGSISDKIVFTPENTKPVPGISSDGKTQWFYVCYSKDELMSQMRLEVESPSLLEEVIICYGKKVSDTFNDYSSK